MDRFLTAREILAAPSRLVALPFPSFLYYLVELLQFFKHFFLFLSRLRTLSITHTRTRSLCVSLAFPLLIFPSFPFLPLLLLSPSSCLLLFYPPLSLPSYFHLLSSLLAPGDRLCGNLYQLFKVSHISHLCATVNFLHR